MGERSAKDNKDPQILLDMLEDDGARWFSTNEFDGLLANLQALDALILATSDRPLLWKWVIITAHAALQSLAVCKLTRTDGFGAKDDGIEKKALAFYAKTKNTLENEEEFFNLAALERMANFPTLMRRLGYALPKTSDDALKEADATNQALFWLHDFRSTYSHFPPVELSVPVSDVRGVVKAAIDVIAVEIENGGWQRRPLIELGAVVPLLERVRRTLES